MIYEAPLILYYTILCGHILYYILYSRVYAVIYSMMYYALDYNVYTLT